MVRALKDLQSSKACIECNYNTAKDYQTDLQN